MLKTKWWFSLESFEWVGRLSHQFTYENSNRFDWAGTDPDLVEVSRYPVLFEMEDSLAPRSSIHHTVISQLEYYFPNASMNYSQFLLCILQVKFSSISNGAKLSFGVQSVRYPPVHKGPRCRGKKGPQ